MPNLDAPCNEVIYRILDTETTGFDPATDRLVEIAAVDLDPRSGALRNPRAHLIDPQREIPADASAVHGITAAMLVGAPRLEEVIGDYRSEQVVYVAHNAAFDAGFLKALPGRWLCTLRLARQVFPQAPGYGNQALRDWLGIEALPEWAAGLAAHRALFDVAVTALLLQRMLTRLGEGAAVAPTVGELLALAARPQLQKVLRFGKYRGRAFEEVPTGYLRWMAETNSWGKNVAHTVTHHLQQRAKEKVPG